MSEAAVAGKERSRPRVFMSYAWSSPEHEQRVLDLATQLMRDGVEVVIDKWDLREGHDKYAFMERTVQDPTITKVLIVADATYAAKADTRAGGVGTETQIISPEVYASVNQEKFIAVVAETDENGTPYLPKFLASRIYIDLSAEEKWAAEYERLVRSIYGKPVHVRPPLGTAPSYLESEPQTVFAQDRLLRAFRDAVFKEKPYSAGLLDDYLNGILEGIRVERLDGQDVTDLGERTVASIGRLLPLRDSFVEMLEFSAQYADDAGFIERIHGFFENLANQRFATDGAPVNEVTRDNVAFIAWELFLYTVSVYVRRERFAAAAHLVDTPYYVSRDRRSHSGAVRPFGIFDSTMRAIEDDYKRSRRLNWITMSGQLLQERATSNANAFRHLVQSDLVLAVRSMVVPVDESEYYDWHPRLFIYADSDPVMEVFRRGASKKYFEKMKVLFGVSTAAQFSERIEAAIAAHRLPRGYRMNWSPEYVRYFLNLANLATI